MKIQEHPNTSRVPKGTVRSFERIMRPYYEERVQQLNTLRGRVTGGSDTDRVLVTLRDGADVQ